jgi:hypothetical protein
MLGAGRPSVLSSRHNRTDLLSSVGAKAGVLADISPDGYGLSTFVRGSVMLDLPTVTNQRL